jgi:hypothetical protein
MEVSEGHAKGRRVGCEREGRMGQARMSIRLEAVKLRQTHPILL